MKPTNHAVSVYIRSKNEEGQHRYEKAGARTVYVPGTQFVLRYEHNGRRAWDKLPEGTGPKPLRAHFGNTVGRPLPRIARL